MSKIKKIYYPILAVVFVIALVLGFVSSHVSFGAKANNEFRLSVEAHMENMNFIHNSYEASNQEKVKNYIASQLEDNGYAGLRGSKIDDYADVVLEEDDGPSFVVQNVTLSAETAAKMAHDELLYIARDLSNIVVIIPGKDLDDVVLFTANYDSAAKSQSATECMQAAAMLQTVIELAKDYENGNKPDKTLLFVFTDAEHEGAYGAYAFRYQFKGFDGIADKVSLAVNFGANGTGALAVSTNKLDVSKVGVIASGLNVAIDEIYNGVSDYDVYDVAKINVFFAGSRDYINTSRDTVENVSADKIRSIGGIMNSLVAAYGYGNTKTTSAGMFSYVGINFNYSSIVSYILGAVAILLLIGAVIEIVRNGKKLSGLMKGVSAQLIVFVATAIVLYACYFVLAAMLAGFGVLPVHAIVTVRYLNLGLFISAMLLGFAAYAGLFLLLRKFYKVNATDAARGGAILIMIVGIVLAFAMPESALIFALTAVLEGIALILTAELSKRFKAKSGADIERLFIYTIPLILLTPAMISVLMLAGYTLSAVYLPLVIMVAMLGFSVIAPYFGLLKPAISKFAAKLPKHTIRVERVVTEQVEGAKKGRFETVTSKKVINEKVEWQYHNRYGIALLGVLSAFLIIMFAVCPTHNFSTNIANEFSYREAVKDNSIVYVWEKIDSGDVYETLRIYDQVAYGYFGAIDKGYSWDSIMGAYKKDFSSDNALHGMASPSISTSDTKKLEFSCYANESIIDVKFSKLSNVKKIIIDTGRDQIEIENDGKDTIRIEFAYDNNDYDNFTVEFEFENALTVGVEYYQYVMGDRDSQVVRRMSEIGDYSDVVTAFSKENFANDITAGMIFHIRNTFVLG